MGLTKDQESVCREQADKYGLPQAFVLGIVEKESAGRVFWTVGSKRLPAIRPEGHYFYRLLSGAERAKAVSQGLAAQKAGKVHVPGKAEAVYRMFQRMVAINPTAAVQSISIGIGQVMGEHAERLGYPSPQAMYKRACDGIEGQVEIMLRFIMADKRLVKAVRLLDYKTFARIYNGPGYRKNQYDTLLKRYVEKWLGKFAPGGSPECAHIASLGFQSVEEFQEHYGLEPDGIVGPLTRAKIDEAVKAGKKQAKAPVVAPAAVAAGSGSIAVATVGASSMLPSLDTIQGHAETAQAALERLSPVLSTVRTMAHAMPVLAAVLACVAAAGAAYALWRWHQAKLIEE